jgi:inward rectifier potassium channel
LTPSTPPGYPARVADRSPPAGSLLDRIVMRPAHARWSQDAYFFLLTRSWPGLLGTFAALYVGINALFALAYLVCGDCIENARAGSFADAFFFSVQTLATIGYGKWAPQTLGGHVLVAAEAFVGLLGFALVTGLVFAKFSRPTARVLFSQVAVVAPRDGVPCLMFRMANERANQIVEAEVHAVLARDETTAEGEAVRRFHDLPLLRRRNALFALTWTAIHPITPESPLAGATPETLAAADAEIVVSLVGLDETVSQTVHARHVYPAGAVRWGVRFADVVTRLPGGGRRVDLRAFHDVVPADVAG